MSLEFESVHKCRLCGEIYSSGAITGKDYAITVINEITVFGEAKNPQAPSVIRPHYCTDGNIGLADFQGFQQKK